MKKVMVLLKAMLILLFLTSCASHGTTVPKAFIGSAEIFQVDDTGTVKVKGYNLKISAHTLGFCSLRLLEWLLYALSRAQKNMQEYCRKIRSKGYQHPDQSLVSKLG